MIFAKVCGFSFVLLLAFPSALLPLPSGRRLFEEAQKAEKIAPDRAIELYEQALQEGLDPSLRRAALYRIKALKQEEPLETPAGRQRSPDEIKRWLLSLSLPGECQKQYLEGIAIAGSKEALSKLEDAIKLARSAGAELRLMGARDLIRAGDNTGASELLKNGPVDAEESGILYADLLLSLKDYKKAAAQIEKMAGQKQLQGARARILYLQGRLLRDTDQEEEAVRFFRLAARYATGELASRYVSLAAFSLYRQQYAIQARALMKGISMPANRNIKLLGLLLAVEVDGDAGAGLSLRRILPSIQKIPESNRSFLEQKAIALEGHPALR